VGFAVDAKDAGPTDAERRQAMLDSPNRYVNQAAPCVGHEGACAAALTAPLAGGFTGWLATFQTGRLALGLFGIGADIQAMSDGLPAGGGVAGRSAEAAADAALAAGRTRGAAAELRVGDQVFTDVSTGGASRTLHPDVNAALDRVAPGERAPWHGGCAEPGCVSQALNAGVNPAGGTSRAVNIGESGRGHGTPKMTCSSCRAMLDFFGIKHD